MQQPALSPSIVKDTVRRHWAGRAATAGVITYVAHGQVEPLYALLVGLPAAAGAAGGAALQQRIHTRTLAYLFAALLVGIAIRMLVQ